MSELGRLLAEARVAKELSLADVEAVTRIRQKYIEALEAGNYAALPRGAVARGFLRTYARFLGVDPEETLRRYMQESGDTGEEVSIAEPGKPRLVDYRAVEVELMDTRPNLSWLRWVIGPLVIAAVGVAIWLLLNGSLGWNPLAVLAPAPTATPVVSLPRASATPPQAAIAAPKPPTVTAPPAPTVLPMPTSDLLPLPIPTTEPTVTPTPRPTATSEVVGRLTVMMQVTQMAWVEVTVDGSKVVLGENFKAGEVRTWEARRSVTVRTGNASGVNLTLNGKELGAMGKINEVIERTWVVAEGGQVTEAAGTVTPTPKPTLTPTPAG